MKIYLCFKKSSYYNYIFPLFISIQCSPLWHKHLPFPLEKKYQLFLFYCRQFSSLAMYMACFLLLHSIFKYTDQRHLKCKKTSLKFVMWYFGLGSERVYGMVWYSLSLHYLWNLTNHKVLQKIKKCWSVNISYCLV